MDLIDQDDKSLFDDTYEKVLESVKASIEGLEYPGLYERIKRLFDYNVRKGKKMRGLMVLKTYRLLAQNKTNGECNEEHLACILGWLVEIIQGFALILDDIMDQSYTRRGQECWHKKSEIGLMAINDGLLLEEECYEILRILFSGKSYYTEIVDLCHQIERYTTYGQAMDLMSNPLNSGINFDLLSKSCYEKIVKYKTSFYSFVFPVKLAMILSDNNSYEENSSIEEILLKIGYLFQIQDDFLDCFGDPAIMDKIGTDIEEGKCCWPVVTALELCDEKQKNALKCNYGIKSEICVNVVKEVYNEIGLTDIYRIQQKQIYDDISRDIHSIEHKSDFNTKVFDTFLNLIINKNK